MSYTVLTPDDQVVSSEIVVSAAWTNSQYTLTQFFTSSTQESGSTGAFYLNVYQTASSLTSAENQFAITYGNILGSGSYYFNAAAPTYTPTKDIYGQYKALILGDENSKFMFDFSSGSNDIVVLTVARGRYKQSFNPGSLTLNLKTGSNQLTLTDNSQVQTTATVIRDNCAGGRDKSNSASDNSSALDSRYRCPSPSVDTYRLCRTASDQMFRTSAHLLNAV